MKLVSPAFKHGHSIPIQYTCDGDDISPPLEWSKPPARTKSFVLIVDDPDAPKEVWVHWVVFNIPSTVRSYNEGVEKMANLPDGTIQGTTSDDTVGYGGPCPPMGTHRYYFTLYALNASLSLDFSATKSDVLTAMQNHILAKAQLMGTYQR